MPTREAILSALFALVSAGEGMVGRDVEGVLCGAARAGLDLTPWLARPSSPQAEPIRISLAESYAKPLFKDVMPDSSFWNEGPEAWRAFAATIGTE